MSILTLQKYSITEIIKNVNPQIFQIIYLIK